MDGGTGCLVGGLLCDVVAAMNLEHPLRASHASPSRGEGEVCLPRAPTGRGININPDR